MTVEQSFQPVSLEMLRLDELVDFDIYFRAAPEQPLVLYREKCLPFTEEARARLVKAGIKRVYVLSDQEELLHDYIERNLAAILTDARLEPREKSGILYTSVSHLVQDALKDPRAGDVIPRSEQIVLNTCNFLFNQKGALEYLMKVSSFDYYTYTHSVNVFVFSLALAQHVFPADDDLMEFGLGAVLHDIGKSQVDPAIVNCRGNLTAEQFEEMKKHTVYGYDLLVGHGNVGPIALDVTRHHHEKLDGSGYPDGLRGEAISEFSRIVTLTDIFDALTTRRSYRQPMSSYPALAFMRDEMGDALDRRLFEALVRLIGDPTAPPTMKRRHFAS